MSNPINMGIGNFSLLTEEVKLWWAIHAFIVQHERPVNCFICEI
jgi:hypothetical protein